MKHKKTTRLHQYLEFLTELHKRSEKNYSLETLIRQYKMGKDITRLLKKLGMLTVTRTTKTYHGRKPNYEIAQYVMDRMVKFKQHQNNQNKYKEMLEQAAKRYPEGISYHSLDSAGNFTEEINTVKHEPRVLPGGDLIYVGKGYVHAKGKWASRYDIPINPPLEQPSSPEENPKKKSFFKRLFNWW